MNSENLGERSIIIYSRGGANPKTLCTQHLLIIIIMLSVLKGEHYAGTTHTDSPFDNKHQRLRCLSETPMCSLGRGQSQGRHITYVPALPPDNYPTD